MAVRLPPLHGPISARYTFRSVADYLEGRYANYTQRFGDPILPGSHTFLSLYVQDSWTATDRLTLNYGFRYDPNGCRSIVTRSSASITTTSGRGWPCRTT